MCGMLCADDSNPFDKVSQEQKDEMKNTTEEERMYELQEMKLIYINFGYSTMANMEPSNLWVDDDDFASDLSSGIAFEIGYHHYNEKNIGFGLAYNYHSSNGSIKVCDTNGNIGTLDKTLKIPSLFLIGGFKHANAANRTMYGGDLKLGGAIYQEEVSVFNGSGDYNCPTVIFGASFFYEYLINKQAGIGISCSGILGSISELYQKGGGDTTLEDSISLNRIEILLSLKFHLKND
jgi:hypothetical protein